MFPLHSSLSLSKWMAQSHCKSSQCWKGALRKQPHFLRPPCRMNERSRKSFIFSSWSPPALERWAGQRAIGLPERDGWGDERLKGKRSRDDLPGERRMERFGLKDGGGGGAHLHFSKCADYVKTPAACLKFHINNLTRSEKCEWRRAHLSVVGCFQEKRTLPVHRTFIFLSPKW